MYVTKQNKKRLNEYNVETVTTFENRQLFSLASFSEEKKEDRDNFQPVGDNKGASLRSRREAKNESTSRTGQTPRNRRGKLRRQIDTKSASKLLVKALPTSTILGRAFLFLAVHICAICMFLMWYGKSNSNLSTRVHSLLHCDRSIRFCGMSETYGWAGVGDTEPTECTNPLPRNVLLFCDEKHTVSHFMASFVICHFISVLVWVTVWVFSEISCLQVKDPYASAKTSLPPRQNNVNDIFIDEMDTKTHEWRQTLSQYSENCAIRSEMEKEQLPQRLLNSLCTFCYALVNICVCTSISMWYWGHTGLSIISKFVIPIIVQAFVQLGSDPNLPAKFIYACRRFTGSINDVKSAVHGNEDQATHRVGNENWSEQVCLFIACHCSASNAFEANQLRRTLEAALLHLPASHIFVCDNANFDEPPDDTQGLVASIDPNINYLYIPIGSKSFAFYWTEKYWLPHLQRCGIVSKQASNYLLTIDDDVRLPKNFYVPIQRLSSDDNIAAVQYHVIASDPSEHSRDGKPLIIGLQDIEYMALSQIPERYGSPPQSSLSPKMLSWCSPVYCSGALAVWRREDFSYVMSKHDCVFHGEDLQMGLILIGSHTSKRMICCDDRDVVIPTTAPSTIGDLMRQRVKSWELVVPSWGMPWFLPRLCQAGYRGIRGHKTSMKSVSWCMCKALACLFTHDPSLLIVRTTVWFFLFPSFRWENVIGLFVAAVMLAIQYTGPIINYFHSRDHVEEWRLTTLREWLLWPVYLWGSTYMVFLAYIYNLTAYGHALKPPTIASREVLGDVPPCPPDLFPDWRRVWKTGNIGKGRSNI